jgi:chemotaxis protein histidine kinase CheA
MAASLGYESVAELSHRMEDRMEGVRTAGRVRNADELALLFRALESLEAMVAAVSEDEPVPAVDEALIAALAEQPVDREDPEPVGGEPKKVRT